tara:strand:+ start:1165 stop:1272 length:108 start_codon:yes stop_codon:yes gene_type:complete
MHPARKDLFDRTARFAILFAFVYLTVRIGMGFLVQ